MDAAAQIFAEKGYAATTTRDIAEASDIGESTLYNYFDGKREIFLAIVQRQAEQINAIFVEFSRLETREQMADIFVQVMDILLSQAHYTRALIGEAWFNDEILSQFLGNRLTQISGYLEEYIRSRDPVRTVPPGQSFPGSPHGDLSLHGVSSAGAARIEAPPQRRRPPPAWPTRSSPYG